MFFFLRVGLIYSKIEYEVKGESKTPEIWLAATIATPLS